MVKKVRSPNGAVASEQTNTREFVDIRLDTNRYLIVGGMVAALYFGREVLVPIAGTFIEFRACAAGQTPSVLAFSTPLGRFQHPDRAADIEFAGGTKLLDNVWWA